MKQKNILCLASSAILLFFLFLFQGCSKSSGGNNSTPPATDYYLTASVNGKSFAANFVSTTDGGPGIAGTTTSNGIQFIVGFGIQIVNTNDSSIFVIVFPANTPLNTPTSLSPTVNTGLVYSAESSPGSPNYNVYGTNPAYGGSGTFTITEYDQTKKVVAGTFSATLGSTTNSTVSITNGKFRCTIIGTTSNFPPNVKF
ncbi:MAG TPA: hypothetical protein VKT28_19630 [Puia sp.]|nr:hypothetical protein [Puia sp.]